MALPIEPNEEEKQQKLSEDSKTPFSLAENPPNRRGLDDTHPLTDSGVQAEELYEEGLIDPTMPERLTGSVVGSRQADYPED